MCMQTANTMPLQLNRIQMPNCCIALPLPCHWIALSLPLHCAANPKHIAWPITLSTTYAWNFAVRNAVGVCAYVPTTVLKLSTVNHVPTTTKRWGAHGRDLGWTNSQLPTLQPCDVEPTCPACATCAHAQSPIKSYGQHYNYTVSAQTEPTLRMHAAINT